MARRKLSLEERQRQMREKAARQAAEKKQARQAKAAEYQRNKRHALDLSKEEAEIAELGSRGMKCPYCNGKARLHKRTGQILPW